MFTRPGGSRQQALVSTTYLGDVSGNANVGPHGTRCRRYRTAGNDGATAAACFQVYLGKMRARRTR